MDTPTLFQTLLGDQAARLPPLVARLHARHDLRVYRGEADVQRGNGLLSRVAAAAAAPPPASTDTHLRVTIEPWRDGERWTRNFGGSRMQSRMWAGGGLLRERLGLITFGFKLGIEDDALIWRVARVSCLGVPLPSALFRGVIAREFDEGGRYRFDVRAVLPIIGLLVHYRGWLDVE